jgi:cytochrome c556
MCRLCWIISLILLLVVGAMTYKFIIAGSTVTASDGRQALLLEPAERDLVLGEMRAFLASVQAITQGLSEEDMATVVTAARQVGANAQQAVPGSLVGKLPLSFKQLGFDTHRKFDLLALDAEQLGDPSHTLEQLSDLMQNCVACHAMYRIDAVPGK